MKDDDIHMHIMGGDYILSPFALKKLRESLMLAVSFIEPDIETPIHPAAVSFKRYGRRI